jgi:hypothetical protein
MGTSALGTRSVVLAPGAAGGSAGDLPRTASAHVEPCAHSPVRRREPRSPAFESEAIVGIVQVAPGAESPHLGEHLTTDPDDEFGDRGELASVRLGGGVMEAGVGTGNGAGSGASRFKAGHPGRRGAKPGETGPAPGTRVASRLLRDMRWVYDHEAAEDLTPGQKMCRKVMEDNPREFLAQLARLEAAHQPHTRTRGNRKGQPANSGVEEPVEMDQGSERAQDAVERLLAEFQAKRGHS